MAAIAAVNNMGACAHNPRGNLWFNDQTTYGHKLLMKMGWSKGKGLGKNEDGIKENLSVKFRNTNSGLGYKDDAYSNIMKTEYESILKNLSANYSQRKTSNIEKDDKDEYKSSEQKSKIVKSKLRYPKLFFGKDVTKYSEEDMKSIFICSLPSKDNQEIPQDSGSSQNQQSENEFPKVAETYSSTLNISDYFAKKMKEKKNFENFKKDGGVVFDKEERNEEIISDADCDDDIDLEQTESKVKAIEIAENSTTLSRKKSSKKRKRKTKISIYETDSPHISNNGTDIVSPNKKKQKLLENLCENNVSEIEVCEAGKGSKINSPKHNKKIRKTELCDYENTSSHILANEGKISCQIELSSSKALQLKKKHKKNYGDKKSIFTDIREHALKNSQVTNDHCSVENELNDVIFRKKKKKKKKLKKLKSCLKSKTGNYSLKNVSFSENVSYRIIGTDYESVECLSDKEVDLDEDYINETANHTLNTQLVHFDKDDDNNCSENKVEKMVFDEHSKEDSSFLPESSDVEVKELVLDEEIKDNCSLSSLPTSSNAEVQELVQEVQGNSLSSFPLQNSPYYNSWVESQTQASRMKMYKNMLKKIKKHKVLKTSNLLCIKGYGNWGLK